MLLPIVPLVPPSPLPLLLVVINVSFNGLRLSPAAVPKAPALETPGTLIDAAAADVDEADDAADDSAAADAAYTVW